MICNIIIIITIIILIIIIIIIIIIMMMMIIIIIISRSSISIHAVCSYHIHTVQLYLKAGHELVNIGFRLGSAVVRVARNRPTCLLPEKLLFGKLKICMKNFYDISYDNYDLLWIITISFPNNPSSKASLKCKLLFLTQ